MEAKRPGEIRAFRFWGVPDGPDAVRAPFLVVAVVLEHFRHLPQLRVQLEERPELPGQGGHAQLLHHLGQLAGQLLHHLHGALVQRIVLLQRGQGGLVVALLEIAPDPRFPLLQERLDGVERLAHVLPAQALVLIGGRGPPFLTCPVFS